MDFNVGTIQQLELDLIEAIKTSDVEWLENVLHDELQFVIPTGEVITKSMDLQSHRARQMKVEWLRPEIEEIKIVNNCAVVVVVYDTKGSMMGTPISGRFRYFRVWSRFDDGIKIIGGSCHGPST